MKDGRGLAQRRRRAREPAAPRADIRRAVCARGADHRSRVSASRARRRRRRIETDQHAESREAPESMRRTPPERCFRAGITTSIRLASGGRRHRRAALREPALCSRRVGITIRAGSTMGLSRHSTRRASTRRAVQRTNGVAVLRDSSGTRCRPRRPARLQTLGVASILVTICAVALTFAAVAVHGRRILPVSDATSALAPPNDHDDSLVALLEEAGYDGDTTGMDGNFRAVADRLLRGHRVGGSGRRARLRRVHEPLSPTDYPEKQPCVV